jgi:hypothetical protein
MTQPVEPPSQPEKLSLHLESRKASLEMIVPLVLDSQRSEGVV